MTETKIQINQQDDSDTLPFINKKQHHSKKKPFYHN